MNATIDYATVGETIRADYRQVTPQYRRDDEIEVTTDNHRHISTNLRRLCDSFPAPIRAMDVGCGTGRYFHCLRNVRFLLGIDITEEMLRAAEHPVRGEEIAIPEIRLVCANFYLINFPPQSFELIYSLGMFGNGCPVTVDVCNRFYDWLVPGGKLYFNTVDIAGMRLRDRSRRHVRGLLYPLLPQPVKSRLDARAARHPFYGMSRRELEQVLKQSRFETFEVTSHRCESPLWNGRHLECLATKKG